MIYFSSWQVDLCSELSLGVVRDRLSAHLLLHYLLRINASGWYLSGLYMVSVVGLYAGPRMAMSDVYQNQLPRPLFSSNAAKMIVETNR
jgi:hypothetical protein